MLWSFQHEAPLFLSLGSLSTTRLESSTGFVAGWD
jgi:hypothetical protein